MNGRYCVNMKIKIVLLSIVLVTLQHRLWFGDGNVFEARRLSNEIAELSLQVKESEFRNDTLELEVLDLKNGNLSIESRARSELSMIKKGETYYRYMR